MGEHGLEERRVPSLLVRLERDRLAQLGIALDVRHRLHARARGALAAHRLAPERQRAEPVEIVVSELGPA
jgi:hypothetical protein